MLQNYGLVSLGHMALKLNIIFTQANWSMILRVPHGPKFSKVPYRLFPVWTPKSIVIRVKQTRYKNYWGEER